MISEQELSAAIVTIEQSIRDAEEEKRKFKQDAERLKELSLRLAIDRTKLQALHCVQGIASMMTEHERIAALKALSKQLDELTAPIETELFHGADTDPERERRKLLLRTKIFVLKFAGGEEKKIA